MALTNGEAKPIDMDMRPGLIALCLQPQLDFPAF